MQTNLFDSKPDSAFQKFHSANPHVYTHLVRLARQAKSQGKHKIGIGMLFEVMRWEIWLTTSDPVFKMNNNYRSRYSRLIMDSELDLDNIFNIRELHD